MRALYFTFFSLLILTSCFDDESGIAVESTLEGQWEITEGTFLWDNNQRVSTLNPAFDSIPALRIEFAPEGRYLVTHAFYVTNTDLDTVTISNGIQEGTFELIISQDGFLDFSGQLFMTENVSTIMDDADLRYGAGNTVDTLWIERLKINNLLQGEINGVFLREGK